MGCYRSLAHDRARNRDSNAKAGDNFSSAGNSACGLMSGYGYGVLRMVEVSAEATPTQDAVQLRMVEVKRT